MVLLGLSSCGRVWNESSSGSGDAILRYSPGSMTNTNPCGIVKTQVSNVNLRTLQFLPIYDLRGGRTSLRSGNVDPRFSDWQVLADPNADPRALLTSANNTFQTQYLNNVK